LSSPEVTITEAEVNWSKDNLFVGSDKAGHSVVFDSSGKGVAKGVSPMSALLTCVGACSGMDIIAILGKRKQKVTSLRIEVRGEKRAFGNPKPFTAISLKYILAGEGLEKRYVEEAITGSMEKYCSVAATVNGRAKISYEYEVQDG